MGHIFEETMKGISMGSLLGGAVGTLLTGATFFVPGLNVVVAPVRVAALATKTITVSGAAVGTLLGAGAGGLHGASMDKKEKQQRYYSSSHCSY